MKKKSNFSARTDFTKKIISVFLGGLEVKKGHQNGSDFMGAFEADFLHFVSMSVAKI